MKGLRQSNKGFTLVELCVTLVILSLIAATSVFGLVSWQAYATYMQQNENAEMVYIAAKSKLAKMKANNTFDEYKDWKACKIPSDKVSEYSGKTVYYAACKKGDYDNYSEGSLTNDTTSVHVVFDLIADSIYDKTLLDACISIEYTEDGKILSVFFSDRCDKFTYGSGGVDISQRTAEKLEENVVGCYTAY